MGLLSSMELPHWLMIAGAALIAMGILGLALTRNKESATPEQPLARHKMPPLPNLLDSSRRKNSQ
jgi:hypothetical protein